MRLIGLAVILTVSLVLEPLAVDAQPAPKTPRIGLLSTGTDPSHPLPPQWLAFFDGMRALGWVDGKNIVTERRFAAGKSERVPGFATELAQLGVDVIVATGLRENEAVRRATTTIPVVMVVVDDPVESGFVRSLARPGETSRVLSSAPPVWARNTSSYSRKQSPRSPAPRFWPVASSDPRFSRRCRVRPGRWGSAFATDPVS